MKIKFLLFLLLILGLFSQNRLAAQETAGVSDRIIGSTFKTLAKAYVSIADMNKLKKNNINKITGMDESKFQKRYAKAYVNMKDLPANLKSKYGITEHMTKAQAVKSIEKLDKKNIGLDIDCIPDVIIARQFKEYLRGGKQEAQKSDIIQQINALWSRMIEKISKK